MTKTTLVCSLFLFAACQQKLGTVSNDSSPIIISDGSVKLNQPDHFRVHGTKRASIKIANHKPTLLGFQCDPNAAECSAGDCDTASPAPKCQIKLAPLSKWSLDVSDGSTVASMTWDGGKPEKIGIALQKGFTIEDGADNTVDLKPSNNPLKSATFTSGASVYNFTCPAGKMC